MYIHFFNFRGWKKAGLDKVTKGGRAHKWRGWWSMVVGSATPPRRWSGPMIEAFPKIGRRRRRRRPTSPATRIASKPPQLVFFDRTISRPIILVEKGNTFGGMIPIHSRFRTMDDLFAFFSSSLRFDEEREKGARIRSEDAMRTCGERRINVRDSRGKSGAEEQLKGWAGKETSSFLHRPLRRAETIATN